ncbi:sulfate ABC transporter substrate-binding protein [Propionibacterium freudenreichii]|uniref:sulfate ABC transporter substrate-binding protein n=1 Tax=Propionibacterium freudenreichii TaxID=1744 RepID=UPI0021A46A32|nr:sulfate ABC transporter substrate-binding protein [Propionibacterium freudenreichii]
MTSRFPTAVPRGAAHASGSPGPRPVSRRRFLLGVSAVVGASALGASALAGCSNIAWAGTRAGQLTIVGFAVLSEADLGLAAEWGTTPGGSGVKVQTSFGASGEQSRNVANGLPADFVHFSLSSDMTRLVDNGLVSQDWKKGAHNGIVTKSVVVLVVRPGNPLGITGWDDLARPDVKVVTPNPSSSGSARWNILAAWAHVGADGKHDDQAEDFLGKVLGNTVSLPGSGRDATTAFTSGNADVLISYENEAILARHKNPGVFDYIVPDDTLTIENPGAVLTNAQSASAASWLDFAHSERGQGVLAGFGFRPLAGAVPAQVVGANDPGNPYPTPDRLLTIDKDFGGWSKVNKKFFADGGLITKLLSKVASS